MSAETYRYEHYDPEGNSFSNGPTTANGNSSFNGPNANGPGEPVRHGWFCWCSWCLAGHK